MLQLDTLAIILSVFNHEDVNKDILAHAKWVSTLTGAKIDFMEGETYRKDATGNVVTERVLVMTNEQLSLATEIVTAEGRPHLMIMDKKHDLYRVDLANDQTFMVGTMKEATRFSAEQSSSYLLMTTGRYWTF